MRLMQRAMLLIDQMYLATSARVLHNLKPAAIAGNPAFAN
jgi:hypothetical protein